MAALKGKLFLLSTGSPLADVLSARSLDFQISSEAVDVTTKGDDGARTLLADGGVTSVTINMEGVFEDTAQHHTFITRAQARSLDAYTITSDSGEELSGTFQLTSFSRSGVYNGEEAYSLTLESSGAVTYDDGVTT
jgi:TP901-1 family phage major tail protein